MCVLVCSDDSVKKRSISSSDEEDIEDDDDLMVTDLETEDIPISGEKQFKYCPEYYVLYFRKFSLPKTQYV